MSEKRIPCEVYSRIVGYIRPIQSWNTAKQVEFEQRITFNVPPEVTDATETHETGIILANNRGS